MPAGSCSRIERLLLKPLPRFLFTCDAAGVCSCWYQYLTTQHHYENEDCGETFDEPPPPQRTTGQGFILRAKTDSAAERGRVAATSQQVAEHFSALGENRQAIAQPNRLGPQTRGRGPS